MSKLIKPVFYEDINELLGGLLKKKRKKKITYNSSKYSILDKNRTFTIKKTSNPSDPSRNSCNSNSSGTKRINGLFYRFGSGIS